MPKDAPNKTYLKNDISKFSIAFDIPEQQKSNTLICGGNATGKSLLAYGIASILQNLSWRIVAFDPVGNYQKISDIPTFYTIREAKNFDEVSKDWFYPYPTESMIYDMSLLIPDLQKSFVNDVLEKLWNTQVRLSTKQWTLIVLEESQLFMRNIRGSVAQNLLRVCSAGRNHKLRTLATSTDLALLDASFIRLTSQRYYSRINVEENARRKFRNYHGGDWLRCVSELDLGFFVYMLRDKLKIIHVPLFEPKRLPEPYQVKPRFYPIQPKPKSLWQKLKELIT